MRQHVKQRQATRRLEGPWPFRLSAVDGRGLVLNLPPLPKPRVKIRPRSK